MISICIQALIFLCVSRWCTWRTLSCPLIQLKYYRGLKASSVRPVACVGVGLLYAGTWVATKECLSNSSQQDGWILAEGLWDKAVHWVLSQVVYRLWEPPHKDKNEVLFDTPDPTDIVYVLWVGGIAVGFCTLKPKGAEICGAGEYYAMATVDTVFVRSSHRRRGHVSALLRALSEVHADIGFSLPISDSMAEVIKKFLSANKQYRRSTWEITGGGNEGCRKLLWYTLQRRQDRSISTLLHKKITSM